MTDTPVKQPGSEVEMESLRREARLDRSHPSPARAACVWAVSRITALEGELERVAKQIGHTEPGS